MTNVRIIEYEYRRRLLHAVSVSILGERGSGGGTTLSRHSFEYRTAAPYIDAADWYFLSGRLLDLFDDCEFSDNRQRFHLTL